MEQAGSSDGEWEEASLEEVPCTCLFCSREDNEGSGAILKHCSEKHNFDLLQFSKKLERPDPAKLLEGSPVCPPWSDDCYLIPFIQDDPLLQLDFEPDEASREVREKEEVSLERRLSEAEVRAAHYQESLQLALQDLEKMRIAVGGLVGGGSGGDATPSPVSDEVEDNEGEEEEEWCAEEGYFASYSHFKIHEEMLQDEVRTDTYKWFLEKNSEMLQGKVVLDIGCGTGILSLLAARAGAKQVYAVDNSNIVYRAMDIVRENGYEDKVSIIKGKVEEVTLPVDHVDIIISEWMGYFLLYESMLDTVIYARDKWLTNPQNVFPNKCGVSLAAMGNCFEYQSRVHFWDDVFGFKMSCMKEEVLREPSVQLVDRHSIISSTDTIQKFDISKVKISELDFKAGFALTMHHDTICHALVGFFDVAFENVAYPTCMSTGPQDQPTHWKQTIFYLHDPLSVHTGDLLSGTLSCRKSKHEPRALKVTIKFELHSFLPNAEKIKVEQTYYLN